MQESYLHRRSCNHLIVVLVFRKSLDDLFQPRKAFKPPMTKELGIGAGECTPDGRFSLEACRCIGACGLAPVLTVNDEVYGKITEDDVPEILAKYQN